MKNKINSATSAIGICALAALVCVFLVFVITFKDEKSAAADGDPSLVTYLSEAGIDIVKDDKNIIFSNATEDQLESELELKRMINYIKPLMSIFLRKNSRQKKYLVPSEKDDSFYNQDKDLMMKEARSLQRRNKRKRKPSEGSTVLLLVPERQMDARYDYDDGDDFDRYGIGGDFGEYVLASGGGSYSCCKNNRFDLIPLVALLALAGLLLYYITVTTTTTASSGRKRRQVNTQHKAFSNEEEDTDYQDINCNQETIHSV